MNLHASSSTFTPDKKLAGWLRLFGKTILCSVFFATLSLAAEKVDLQAMINAAEVNSTIRVEGGVVDGPIVIGKPLTIIGIDNPIIEGNRSGHVVHIKADDVALEGFVVRASGSNLGADNAGIMIEGQRARVEYNLLEDVLHGIYLKKASRCRVAHNKILGKEHVIKPIEDVIVKGARPVSSEFCAIPLNVNQRGNGIHLWNSSDNQIEENDIEHTRDGIYFSFSNDTVVRGNHVSHVRYGLHYMYSDNNVFESNRFEENAAGAAIMYSNGLFISHNTFTNNRGRRAYGLLLQSVERTTFIENVMLENTVGIYLENCNRNTFIGNDVSKNYIGIRMTSSSSQNSFSANTFSRNLHSVEVNLNSSANEWSVKGRGNYWANSETIDLNGDGLSDLPHFEADALGRVRQQFREIGLLSKSPFLQLLQFIQSRTPIPGLPTIEDPSPLTHNPKQR